MNMRRPGWIACALLLAACGDDLPIDCPSPADETTDPTSETPVDEAPAMPAPDATDCDDGRWQGNFLRDQWKDPAAVAALRKARVVDGTLELGGDAPIELPALEQVTGGIFIDRAVPAVRLPALWSVGGSVTLRERATIGTLAVPALQTIGGYLDLGGTSHMAELRLPSLTRIGGSLRVWYGSQIDHLAMPALTTVGDLLSIGTPTCDFPVLSSVGGAVSVHGPMRDLDGLRALERVGGDLRLSNAPSLVRADLPALQRVGGRFGVLIGADVHSLTRVSAPQLKATGAGVWLAGAAVETIDLGALENPGGDVDLSGMPALRTLTLGLRTAGAPSSEAAVRMRGLGLRSLELPRLTTATGAIEIHSNDALEVIRLDALTGGTVTLHANRALTTVSLRAATELALDIGTSPALARLDAPALVRAPRLALASVGLTDLSGLPVLRSVGTLRLGAMPMTSLAELRWLTEADDVHILGFPALASLDGLDNLAEIRGRLEIADNAALTDLSALSRLTAVGPEGMHIRGNPLLAHLHGLEALARVEGSLRIAENGALVDLAGLGGLRHLGGSLHIDQNPALATLQGLSSLLGISRHVIVQENPVLTKLDGLSALRSVGEGVWISENPQLGHLGLDGLAYIGRTLDVLANPQLPRAEIDELRARTGNPGSEL